MAQATAIKSYFTFVKGLVTEASPLTFPENSSYDEVNFVLNVDGSRQRRKGLAHQTSKILQGTYSSTDAVVIREWRAAAGDSDANFTVVQKGRYLYFYPNDTADLGANLNTFEYVAIDAFKTSAYTLAQVQSQPVDMSYGLGYLFVTHPYCNPFYVEYDPATAHFIANRITIQSRDLKGIEDNLGVEEQPSTLSSEHAYNLFNQGWTQARIDAYQSYKGKYPANNQVHYFGKYTDINNGKETWAASQVDQQTFGNTHAPRGYYMQDIFDTTQSFSMQGRLGLTNYVYNHSTTTMTVHTDGPHNKIVGDSVTFGGTEFTYTDTVGNTQIGNINSTYTVESVVDADTLTFNLALDYGSDFKIIKYGYMTAGTVTNPSGTVINQRPRAVAFFAGRVWYSGIAHQTQSGRIYFSQVLKNTEQMGLCYQDADPTSEHISDLLPTDGGYVVIPEMGQVLRMLAVGNSLAVFADNGVWLVSGSSEDSFTATSYGVRKIMEDHINAPNSIVTIGGSVLFWSGTGIYSLEQDKISGFLTPNNLSQATIQSLYNKIPNANKTTVKSVYNSVDNYIMWLYNDSAVSHKVTDVLVLDLRLGAFYKHQFKVGAAGNYVLGASTAINSTSGEDKIQFFACNSESSHDYSFAKLSNTAFKDWAGTTDEQDAAAYIETGYDTGGDAMRSKQAPRIMCFIEKNSAMSNSCYMQAKWEWTDSGNQGKWSRKQQVFRDPRNMPVVVTSNKVNGRGKAAQLRFETEPGMDCKLLGWAIKFQGTTNV